MTKNELRGLSQPIGAGHHSISSWGCPDCPFWGLEWAFLSAGGGIIASQVIGFGHLGEHVTMNLPKAGDLAPDFELQTDSGDSIRLSDYRGRKVVLFFYPRADTPGCIKEACGFRDDYSLFTDQDMVVLGISPDTVRAQAKFSEKYGFPFPLLADKDRSVAHVYGVWKPSEQRPSGAAYGTRTTFLIDESGLINHVYEGVKPLGHSQEVYAALSTASD